MVSMRDVLKKSDCLGNKTPLPVLCSSRGVKKRLYDYGRVYGDMANQRRTSKLDQQIDENLRRVYSDAANEPLPDRFTQLLDQLREQERQRSGQSSEEEE